MPSARSLILSLLAGLAAGWVAALWVDIAEVTSPATAPDAGAFPAAPGR